MTKWTNEEIEFLKQAWSTLTKKEIEKVLCPQHTWNSIKDKAKKLNLHRDKYLSLIGIKHHFTPRKFTMEEIHQIIEDYKNGVKVDDIINKYNVNMSYIFDLLKKFNVETNRNGIVQRKHEINEDYFEKIDTEAKAYFLGLIYADGCIHRNSLRLSLKKEDGYIIYELAKQLNAELCVKEVKSGYDTDMMSLTVFRKKLVNDLKRKGINYNKTFDLKFSDENIVPKHLQHHFVRGFFDGDGTIGFNKANKNYYVGFIGTKEMLSKILEIHKSFGYNSKLYKNRKSNKIYEVHFGGIFATQKWFEYMYKNAHIYLKRKFQRFVENQQLLLQRYPNLVWEV